MRTTALNRECSRNSRPVVCGIRSISPRCGAASAYRQARTPRPFCTEDQIHSGNRKGCRQRSIDLTEVGNMDADEAHAALTALARRRPLDRRHLSPVLSRPRGCISCRRSRGPGVARIALSLRKRPDAKALAKMAEAWRPWRGVAAHLLWAYYHVVKKRDVVPVQPNGRPKEAASKRARKRKKKNG